MTMEEAINDRNENIGKACVAFHDATMKLQRVFIRHRQAKETAEADEARAKDAFATRWKRPRQTKL